MQEGKVYAIRPDRTVIIVDSGLVMPTGLDYYEGDLYVSEISRILKYQDILENLESSPEPMVLNGNLPGDEWHGWKFIRVGPDGKLYIPVGAPCNVCIPDKVWHGRILRMSLDGELIEYFAKGVRNTVGFDWDPYLRDMWFTDNGRDGMGDDKPPDEINRVRIADAHFGFPYIHGNVLDPDFWPQRPKGVNFTIPAYELPAHVAPLGMRFYTGEMFDEKYRGGIFIAEHGSWNRSKKIGYRVSYLIVREGRVVTYEVFAGGWLEGETAWGRPADVQVGPDGALYVSDDLAGCVYRIFK